MEKEALKRIFEFLEEKEEHNMPFKLKLIFNKPLTKEDLNVGGLSLRDTNIISLPKGLKVRFFLDLRNTKINFLPKGLEVHRSLYIKNTALLEYTDEELREMVKPGFIKGKILRQ